MPRLSALKRPRPLRLFAVLATLPAALVTSAAAETVTGRPGGPLPELTLPMLEPGAEAFEDRSLASWAEGRPRLLVYGLPEHPASSLELRTALDLAAGADGAAVAAVMLPRRGLATPQEFRAALGDEAGRAPLFRDDGFQLGRAFGLGSAPSIIAIDASGRLSVVGARSFAQPSASGATIEALVREGLAAGSLPTVEELERFEEGHRLLGRRYLDGDADLLGDGASLRLSERLAEDDRSTLLVFWSVRCPHCTEAMPRYDALARRLEDRLRVLTVTPVPDEAFERETASFIESQGIALPVLLDRDRDIWDGYLVRSTPTLVLIDPSGTIAGVQIGGVADIDSWLEARL